MHSRIAFRFGKSSFGVNSDAHELFGKINLVYRCCRYVGAVTVASPKNDGFARQQAGRAPPTYSDQIANSPPPGASK
jgi:hypothetical protein